MKIILKFRGEIRNTLDWPEAPPTFREPWKQPSIYQLRDAGNTPDTPSILYVEYKLKEIMGDLAFYEASYEDVVKM